MLQCTKHCSTGIIKLSEKLKTHNYTKREGVQQAIGKVRPYKNNNCLASFS